MSKYTVKHFIKFFSAIPDEKWMVGGRNSQDLPGVGCALNHAYSHSAAAADSLVELFWRSGLKICDVNDRSTNGKFPQATPKARILAALAHLEKAQAALDNHKK